MGIMNNFADQLWTAHIEAAYQELIPTFKKYNLLRDSHEYTATNLGDDVISNIRSQLLPEIRQSSEDHLYTFDCECISSAEDYKYIFESILKRSQAEIDLKSVICNVLFKENNISMVVSVNGKEHTESWEQNDEWVSKEFFDFVEKLLKEEFSLYLINLPAEDQCASVFLIDLEGGAAISNLFKWLDGEISWTKYFGYWSSVLGVTCILGLIATTLIGWCITSFSESAIYSAIGWSIFAAIKSSLKLLFIKKETSRNKSSEVQQALNAILEAKLNESKS